MNSEHTKLCAEYGIDPSFKMSNDAYILLVERLNAKVASLCIQLSAAHAENHALQDKIERGDL